MLSKNGEVKEVRYLQIPVGTLIEARKKAQKSQYQCAKELNIHVNTFSNIENGKTERGFTERQVRKLESFLHTKFIKED